MDLEHLKEEYWVFLIRKSEKYENFIELAESYGRLFPEKTARWRFDVFCSALLFGEGEREDSPRIGIVINSLVNYFTNIKIISNRLMEYKCLMDTIAKWSDDFKNANYFIRVLERMKKDIFPLISKNKKQEEMITISNNYVNAFKYSKSDIKLIENYVFSNFRVDGRIFHAYFHDTSARTLSSYYSSLKDNSKCAIFSDIEKVFKDGLESGQELLRILSNMYLKQGKSVKTLLKDIQKVECIFKSTILAKCEWEEIIECLEYYYNLFLTHFTKQQVHEYLENALAQSFESLIFRGPLSFFKKLVIFYNEKFTIPIDKCSKKNFKVSDFLSEDFYHFDTEIAMNNCPKSWKVPDSNKTSTFPLHPLTYYFIIGNTKEKETFKNDISWFIQEYGETLVTIPILIDYAGPCKEKFKSDEIQSIPWLGKFVRIVYKKVKFGNLYKHPEILYNQN